MVSYKPKRSDRSPAMQEGRVTPVRPFAPSPGSTKVGHYEKLATE